MKIYDVGIDTAANPWLDVGLNALDSLPEVVILPLKKDLVESSLVDNLDLLDHFVILTLERFLFWCLVPDQGNIFVGDSFCFLLTILLLLNFGAFFLFKPWEVVALHVFFKEQALGFFLSKKALAFLFALVPNLIEFFLHCGNLDLCLLCNRDQAVVSVTLHDLSWLALVEHASIWKNYFATLYFVRLRNQLVDEPRKLFFLSLLPEPERILLNWRILWFENVEVHFRFWLLITQTALASRPSVSLYRLRVDLFLLFLFRQWKIWVYKVFCLLDMVARKGGHVQNCTVILAIRLWILRKSSHFFVKLCK